MQRFFFDMDDGRELIVDDIGYLFKGAEEARDEGRRALAMVADQALSDHKLLMLGQLRMLVRSWNDELLYEITFDFARQLLSCISMPVESP